MDEPNTINTKTLANIIDEAKALELAIWDSGGEITPEVDALIKVNAQELSHKVDNYAMLLQRLEMAEAHYKQVADRYRDVAGKIGKLTDRLQNNIKEAMDAIHSKSLNGELNSFSIRLNPPSVAVIDEGKIDRHYFKEVISYSLEKKRIKDDLKMGIEVNGCRLEQGVTLKVGIRQLSLRGVDS